MEYSRFVPTSAGELAVIDTVDHVRAHLSSIADSDDDPDTRAEDVEISYDYSNPAGVLVRGYLDAEPNAPYLMPDFNPDDDNEFTWEG